MADEDLKPQDQLEDDAAVSQTDDDQGDSPVEGQPPEGVSEKAEARYKHLAEMKNKYKEDAEHWKNIAARLAQVDEQATRTNPSSQSNNFPNEEVERAYSVLRERGVATQEDLERLQLRLKWDRLHSANEERYNQEGSRYPKYVPEEIEEYARQKGISDPTAAYRDMYFDEILDAARSSGKSRPASTQNGVKPTRPTNNSKEPLTLEDFRAKLAGPGGQEYYDKLAKNPAKFNALVQELSSQN